MVLLGVLHTGKAAPDFFKPVKLDLGTTPSLLSNGKSFDNQHKIPAMINFGSNDGTYGMGIQSGLISLALPGVGLYMANKHYFSLIFLPVCYGLVGGGLATMASGKRNAEDAYAMYMIEKNPILQDEYLETADLGKEKNASGQKMLAGGLVIWGLQAGWSFIYGYYNDHYRARDAKWNNKVTLMPSGGYDFRTNSATLNLSIKF